MAKREFSTLYHYDSKNHSYGTRSKDFVQRTVPQETNLQRKRTRIAKRISKTWRINRKDCSSRGLQNPGLACYRVSALQLLAHLPKFQNWIYLHDEPDQNWPCNHGTDSSGRIKDVNLINDRPDDPLFPEEGMQCVACLMKWLLKCYWGTDGQVDGKPEALSASTHPMREIHAISRRWYLKPRGANPSVGEEEDREMEMNEQQTADELMLKVLQGCEESIDLEINKLRLEQYCALFKLNTKETRTCTACNGPRSPRPIEDTSFIGLDNISLLPHGQPDTVEDAIRRYMQPYILGKLVCKRCGATVDVRSHSTIEAAPEYLRIKLSLDDYFNPDEFGNPGKNKNPVAIPANLDLVEHAANNSMPLRYKLIGVLYHSGSTLNSGHYVSVVTGPKRIYSVNDEACTVMGRATNGDLLTKNPMERDGAKFHAVVLMYERVHNEKSVLDELR